MGKSTDMNKVFAEEGEGKTHVHICWRGPIEKTRTGDFQTKWCFACRKHLSHEWIVTQETPDNVNYGWYEPETHWECPECEHDNTRFPGW